METIYGVLNLGDLTCRICLQNHEEIELNSIDDMVEYGEESLVLRDVYLLLLRATTIQTSAINYLHHPARFCIECTNKLINAYELMCTLESSEKLLQEYIGLQSEAQLQSQTVENLHTSCIKTEIDIQDLHVEEVPDENVNDDLGELDTDLLSHYNSENESAVIKMEQAILSDSECITEIETNQVIYGTATSKPLQSGKRKPLIQNCDAAVCSRFAIGSRLGTFESSRCYKCDVCHRAFAKSETLQKHVKTVHTCMSAESIAALAPKPTEEKPLQCCYCPRTFAREYALRRHTLAMHSEDVRPGETADNKKSYRCKRGLCPHCGCSFSKANLIIHIRRHTGEKPYKCDSCEKGFPRRQDLVIHKRQHTGERPHVCTICGKSFIRPNKLSRHMRIHTGQRPYKCSECEKSFAQSNDLRIHIRRHTGEKPYMCNICGEGFICGTALKTHRKLSSHEPSVDESPDPYAKCRVNARTTKKDITDLLQ